jgi:hypothetical protein
MQRKIVEANCSNPVHNKWEQALNGSLLRIIYLKSFTFWNLHRSVHVSRVESFNIPFFPHTVFKMLSRKLTSFLEATESVRVLHAFPFQYCWRQSKTPPIHEARFYSYEFESLEFANLRIYLFGQKMYSASTNNRESTTKSPCCLFTHKNTFAFSTLAFHCNHVHFPCL